MQTLLDLFETFEKRGEKTAFVNRTGVRRYRGFLSGSFHDLAAEDGTLSWRKTAWRRGTGCSSGDPTLPGGRYAYWGIIVRGAIAVPVDFMSDRARAETIRGLTSAKVVLQSRFKPERMTAAPIDTAGRSSVPARRCPADQRAGISPHPRIRRSSSILPALPAIRKGLSSATKT